VKVLWVCCSEAIAPDVMECLDKAGTKGYAVWRDMLHKDNVGDKTHWGDGIFPGKDWAFMVCCEEETVREAVRLLKALREQQYVAEAGLEAYILDAESVF